MSTEKPTRWESLKAAIDGRELAAVVVGYLTLVSLQVAVNVLVYGVSLETIWNMRSTWVDVTILPWVVAVIVYDRVSDSGGEPDQ